MNASADTCICEYCKNFVEQRANVFPKEVKALFENLGVDLNKENEVSEYGETENGLHKYFGCLHFAGEIRLGESCKVKISDNSSTFNLTEITENFSIGFCKRNNRFVEIWFETNLPWVIEGDTN